MKKFLLLLMLALTSYAVLGQNAHVEKLVSTGIDYMGAKKYQESTACFEKAIKELNPMRDQEAISMLRQMIKKNHWMQCADSLFYLASSCQTNGEYERSTKYFEQVLLYFDSLGMPEMFSNTYNLIAENDIMQGIAFLEKAQYDTALIFCRRAAQRAEPGSRTYRNAHRWIGNICDQKATETNAGVDNLERAVALCKEGERHYDTAGCVIKGLEVRLLLASKLKLLERNDEAKDIYEQIISSFSPVDSLQRVVAKAFTKLGEIEVTEGEYNSAIEHLERGYELGRETGEMGTSYGAAHELYSIYQYHIKDKKKAELWKQRSEQDRKKMEKRDKTINIKDSPMLKQTRKKTDAYKATTAFWKKIRDGKIEEGIKEGRELAARYEKDTDIPLTITADCYSFIATGEAKKGDFKAAVVDSRHAIKLFNEAGVEGKKELKREWYSLAAYLWRCKDYEAALLAADTCVVVSEDYYGPQHEETMEAYLLRGDMNALHGNKERALKDVEHYFDMAKGKIQHNFVYLTNAERSGYWGKFESTMRRMAFFAYGLKDYESEYTDVLFDGQLLAKGLLLNTESSLQKAISEDSDLREAFTKIRLLRKKADDSQTPRAEAEQALLEADLLERRLGSKANTLYQFTDFLKIEKTDVQKHLPSDAVAVEFVSFMDTNKNSILGALVLSSTRKHARFVPLVAEDELQQRQDEVGELIWRPILAAAGEGVKEIFFAPTGILHILPIESAVMKDGRYVDNEQINLHRVSSTRWVVPQQNLSSGEGAVVYGGLRYDLTVNELLSSVAEPTEQNVSDRLIAKNSPKKGNLRGSKGLDYLEGTKEEAKLIEQTLKGLEARGMNVELKTGAEGTEESFKALNGRHKRLIHIATHGMCDTLANDDDMDAVLSRCGLYFAGADNLLMGEALPKGLEDGFLSASEISEMDLQGLELVTLSACETGKGKVTGDGVFGLQRGFKLAGAKSILMSLWKVDDRATAMLMSEFYRLWLGGMSKHDALESAKAKVRNTKGWESPEFWAAFILLDGK